MARFGTLGSVTIAGASMEPTYRNGARLLVRWNTPTTAIVGKVYLIEREEQPGVIYVKRLQKSHGTLHWFAGDNPASQGSKTWGWLPENCIRGTVLFRYWG